MKRGGRERKIRKRNTKKKGRTKLKKTEQKG